MWLLLTLILIMPYEANPYLYLADNLLGVFPDFTVIKLLGLLGFAWAGLRLAAGDPAVTLLGSRPARLFLLFVAAMAVVALFHGTGFQYAISRYLGFLVFLPFVVVAVRSEDDLRRVLKAMVLAYVLVFPYAVRQMWRFDARLGTGLYETNYLATILVLLVPLAFVFASQAGEPRSRALWTGAGLLLVLMVFLTSSRGGFLGLLAAGMVYVYRRRGPGGAVAVMAALLAGVVLLPTDVGTRALATIFQSGGELPAGLETSNRAHVALFWAALRMIIENPLLGVGPLNFKALSTSYTGLDIANIAHNTFLEVAAEFGLLALAIFVLLLGATFATLGQVARSAERPGFGAIAGWAEGLRAGLIGFLVSGLFISAQYEKILWLTIFLTIPLGAMADRLAADETLAEGEAPPVTDLVPAPEAGR
jgi:O-antigen ligase